MFGVHCTKVVANAFTAIELTVKQLKFYVCEFYFGKKKTHFYSHHSKKSFQTVDYVWLVHRLIFREFFQGIKDMNQLTQN